MSTGRQHGFPLTKADVAITVMCPTRQRQSPTLSAAFSTVPGDIVLVSWFICLFVNLTQAKSNLAGGNLD